MLFWVQRSPTAIPQVIYWPDWQNMVLTNTQTMSSTCPTVPYFSQTISTQNITSSCTNIYWPSWHEDITCPSLIQERMEAERARLEQYHREQEEATRQRNLAIERSKEIFLEHLTPDQRDTVENNGWFVIEGGKSGKLYRVKSGAIAGNVEELDPKGEKVIARYCCHLNHDFPRHDHHLAQKLMLEWDEEEFLKKANKTMVG
jgi:hypothetical protein